MICAIIKLENNKLPSKIVQKILEQIIFNNKFYRTQYRISNSVAVNENTLWLCHRNGQKKINIDISFNKATDLYDIKAYQIKGVDVDLIFNKTGFYWDNLTEVIAEITGIKQ